MNYLSKDYEVQNPLQYDDIALKGKVASILQNKYDTNKALIDQTMEKYKALQVARPEDREYIAAKIADAESAMNQFQQTGGANLSMNSVRDSMLGAFKSITRDPFVLDAIKSTQNIKQHEALMEEKKKKGTYNAENDQYSKYTSGYYDYMNGKSKSLDSIENVDYNDNAKEDREIIKQISKMPDTKVIAKPNGNGYIIQYKSQILSDDKAKALFEQFSSDKYKKQLAVNGWAENKNKTDEEVLNSFNLYRVDKVKEIGYKKIKSEFLAKTDLVNKDEHLQNAKDYEEQLNTIVNSWGQIKNRDSITTLMYTDANFSKLGKLSAINNKEEKWSGDTAFANKEKLAWEKAKYQLDYQMEQQKIALKEREIENNEYKEGITRDENGNVVAKTEGVETIPLDATFKETRNMLEETENLITTTQGKVDKDASDIYNSLKPDEKKFIDEEMKSRNITKEEAIVKYGVAHESFHPKELRVLNENMQLIKRHQNKIAKYNDDINGEFEASVTNDSFLQSLKDDKGIKMIWKDTNKKERLFSVADVLRAFKIEKGEDLLKRPDLLNALKRTFAADYFLSNEVQNPGLKQISGGFGYLTTAMTKPDDNTVGNALKSRKSPSLSIIAESYGENINDVQKDDPKNPKTKTMQFMMKSQRNNLYNTKWILSANDSLDDKNSAKNLNELLDVNKRREKLSSKLNDDKELSLNRQMVISKDLNPVLWKQLEAKTQGKFVGDAPFTIYLTGSGDYSIVKPTVSKNKEGNDTKFRTSQEPITLSKNDLPVALANKLIDNKDTLIGWDDFDETPQKPNYQLTKAIDRLSMFLSDDVSPSDRAKVAAKATKDIATQMIFYNNQSILGTTEKPTQEGIYMKEIISSDVLDIKPVKGKMGATSRAIKNVGWDLTYNGSLLYSSPRIVVDEQSEDSRNEISELSAIIKFLPASLKTEALIEIGKDKEKIKEVYNKVLSARQ